MKSRSLVLFFCLAAVTVASPLAHGVDDPVVPTDKQNLHLFLLAGQSNMAGRGRVDELAQKTHPQILCLNKSGKWQNAADPLHFDKPKAVGVGLAKSFALDYLRDNPGVTVGLIPCAVGGSPISSWQPGGYHSQTKSQPYDDTVARVQRGLESGTIRGILWHQGEADSKPALAEVYEEQLHDLIARFRSLTGDSDLPFIAGQMGQFPDRPWNESKRMVDAAHKALPSKVAGTAFVNAVGLTHKGDKIHFDSRSYRELGHRYYAAYRNLTAARRPNILLILADDVGREVLGCYGGTSYRTPNIDSLAESGQRYTHCYSMPVCHPSRICLMTGRYPAVLKNPVWGSFPKQEEKNTFAPMLQKAGYATAVGGKWQLSLMKNDLQQPARMGFEEWSVFGWHEGPRYHEPMIYQNGQVRSDTRGKYGPDLYVDFLIDFMKQKRKQPFFAYYSMALCHDVTDDIGRPVPYGPDGRWLNYEEMALDMDRQVGRLISALDQLKLRDNTLILFTTDNGTAGASYLRYKKGKYIRPDVFSNINGVSVKGGKGKLNDWGTRVPLIANWPGRVAAGQVVDDLVDFSDFLPTLQEITGAALPSNVSLNGHSFATSILGTGRSSRRWAYAEARSSQQFVRTRTHKLYSNGRFYDMDADPEEEHPLNDISNNVAAIRTTLEEVLKKLPEPK
ncbi:MAG: sialate O-acetylesterase [Fuerstiella sp.]|jgi:arylsulfatase A-like enzyme|nr:sialate O-acetylesterase [Fuerstiella sp.]